MFRLPYGSHFSGGRGGIRTRDLRLRRPTLYPAELPAHVNTDKAFGKLQCLTTHRWVQIGCNWVLSLSQHRSIVKHIYQSGFTPFFQQMTISVNGQRDAAVTQLFLGIINISGAPD